MIQFLLNSEPQRIEKVPITTTLLDYLREYKKQTGTKEGCASGDCGACTVVLVTLINNQLQYEQINACITLVCSLHGRQIMTVAAAELAEVQQAMVEHHGSQCGFCTPGIIMSLYALQQNKSPNKETQINETLAGNLCRCTGYRPIVNAAKYIIANSQPIVDTETVITQLRQWSQMTATLSHNNQQYFLPKTINECGQLFLEYPTAKIIAGTTDFALEITQQYQGFIQLIDISQVQELQQIKADNQYWYIGAAAPYEQLPQIFLDNYPSLELLLSRLGSMAIRHRGTMGGNIANASPIGDMPPWLLCLDAELLLQRGENQRWLSIKDFFTSYRKTALLDSEFIRQIKIPKLNQQDYFRTYKVSKRFEDDISTVCVAIRCTVKEEAGEKMITAAYVGLGGVAATPIRSPGIEAHLQHKPWTLATFTHIEKVINQHLSPLTDVRASETYRLAVIARLFIRYFHEYQQPLATTQIAYYHA